MYRYMILLFVFCTAVYGNERSIDLGNFKGEIQIGESIAPENSVPEDNASQDLRKVVDGLTIQTFGLDPIYRAKTSSFPLERNLMFGSIKPTHFVITGLKYLKFDKLLLQRKTDDAQNYLKINITAATPILASKFLYELDSDDFSSAAAGNFSEKLYVFLERVRLQVSGVVRAVPRRDGLGSMYQVVGMDLRIDASNLRVIMSNDLLTMMPDLIGRDTKQAIFKMVAQEVLQAVNRKLETFTLN